MTIRMNVSPRVLQWARARSGIEQDKWDKRFPQFEAWLDGTKIPTLRQVEDFARKTFTPIGYFFLAEPPAEKIPIPDFRTFGQRKDVGEHGSKIRHSDRKSKTAISPHLLDTIFTAQARQEWYSQHQIQNGETPLPFVSSASLDTPTKEAAERIRNTLNWTNEARSRCRKVEDAIKMLREKAEQAGVLVMISGIVGSNTHRPLDPAEFRGFALSDPYAPVVFVNGADAKRAQLFTLAHELAHIWLGETGLSDIDPQSIFEPQSLQGRTNERWCNQVAAELLVPMKEFVSALNPAQNFREQLQKLVSKFHVSRQVILLRMREAEILTREALERELERERIRDDKNGKPNKQRRGGGDFRKTKPVQVSRRFARELIASTLEGQTTYTEAFRLLQLNKTSTFMKLGQELGIL